MRRDIDTNARNGSSVFFTLVDIYVYVECEGKLFTLIRHHSNIYSAYIAHIYSLTAHLYMCLRRPLV
jgi:hypothetical protein